MFHQHIWLNVYLGSCSRKHTWRSFPDYVTRISLFNYYWSSCWHMYICSLNESMSELFRVFIISFIFTTYGIGRLRRGFAWLSKRICVVLCTSFYKISYTWSGRYKLIWEVRLFFCLFVCPSVWSTVVAAATAPERRDLILWNFRKNLLTKHFYTYNSFDFFHPNDYLWVFFVIKCLDLFLTFDKYLYSLFLLVLETKIDNLSKNLHYLMPIHIHNCFIQKYFLGYP